MAYKSKFQLFSILCFYGLFFLIISACLFETLTYPGIFLNRTGHSLSKITSQLSLFFFLNYFQLIFSGFQFKYQKKIIVFSIYSIILTIILTVIESYTYANFVFSRLHLNYKGLQTLSLFLSIFLLVFIFSKIKFKKNITIDIKKIFKIETKYLIVVFFILTPILSYLSWNAHLQTVNALNPSVRYLSHTFNLFQDEVRKTAFKNQVNWIFKTSNTYSKIQIFYNIFTISYATLFGLIAILFFLNWLQNKRSSKIATTLILFYFGSIAYTILIIYISVRMFGIGELEAFQGRYISTYLLAMLMFSFYLLMKHLQKQTKLNFSSAISIFILLLIINISILVKIKPADKEFFVKRKQQETIYQKILNTHTNHEKWAVHTIGGEGAISYRFYLCPLNVITPIWQDWDIFMFENPGFQQTTHVFLPSSTDVIQKWSDPRIRKVFKDKKFVLDNALYKVIHDSKDNNLFQLELINNFSI